MYVSTLSFSEEPKEMLISKQDVPLSIQVLLKTAKLSELGMDQEVTWLNPLLGSQTSVNFTGLWIVNTKE